MKIFRCKKAIPYYHNAKKYISECDVSGISKGKYLKQCLNACKNYGCYAEVHGFYEHIVDDILFSKDNDLTLKEIIDLQKLYAMCCGCSDGLFYHRIRR